MTTTATTGHVAGAGVQLAYLAWPGDGPPIVAIHGLSSNAAFFTGVAERMAGRRPLLSVDLRGRGGSDKPAAGYGIAQHADDLAAAIDAMARPPAIVVGHSMGAAVALAVAQRHPDRCAGAVLYDGGPHAVRAMGNDPVALSEFLEAGRGIEGRLTMTFDSPEAYAQHWRSLGIFDATEWSAWVDAYLAADLDGEPGELRPRCSTAAVAEDVTDLLGLAGSPIAAVEVPVLAIAASSGLVDGTGPLVPDAAFDAMRAEFPSFRAVRLPASNHYTVALADPAATATADLLVEFAEACGR